MGKRLSSGQSADTLRTVFGQATKSGRTRTPPLRVSEVSAVRPCGQVERKKARNQGKEAPSAFGYASETELPRADDGVERVSPGSLTGATVLAARRTLRRRHPIVLPVDDGIVGAIDPTEVVRLHDLFGTRSPDYVRNMLGVVMQIARPAIGNRTPAEINAVLAFINGVEPRTEIDAMAAALLYAANAATLSLLLKGRAALGAAEMLRATTALYEALASRPCLDSNNCSETA